ncbi:MAG: carboxy terminal-processing peptidase [Ignavibacterium sp.]|nr:MAG: carboxy terminal-processing peptidase [Ignavibacterium sp.]
MNHKKKHLSTIMKIIIVVLLTALAANFYFAGPAENSILAPDDKDTLKRIEPKNHYTLENQLINAVLESYHYKDFALNDSLSSEILDRYLKSLDHGKIYFLQTDIDSFEKYRYRIDDNLQAGNVIPFYNIFRVFMQRMQDRVVYLDTILSKEFDYTLDEELLIDRKKAEWSKSVAQLNDIWRKRIKNDALNLRLNGKDWDAIKSNLEKRYENFTTVLRQYNTEDVFQVAMNSFTASIDPHTNYLSPITSDNFKIDMSLSLEGIGARLQYDDGYTKVVEIIPGGPAFKSKKLHVDDRIVAVAQDEDGEFVDVVGWRITDVVQLIRGPKESVVRLQLIKSGKPLSSEPVEIRLVRDKVLLEEQSATSSILEIKNDNIPYKFGVINIPKFYSDFEGQRLGDINFNSTSRDVKELLEDLNTQSIDGIIIDLTNNGGGSLDEAVNVTGLFIEDGPVVQVRDMNGKIVVNNDTDPQVVYDGPLAVLVNRFSASASEIFSGAIQNYGRGIIIGENTYGKGTVQNLIDLNRISSKRGFKLGQIKLTIAKYYRIDGSSTQRLGVIPDILFPSPISPEEFGESSKQNALKWDRIDPADYDEYFDLDSLLPELKNNSKQRTDADPEFDYIREDILEYKESLKDKYVSLNEKVRKKEKEEREEREFQRENERRKIKGLKLLEKGETPQEEEVEDVDPFLYESAQILADLIQIIVG